MQRTLDWFTSRKLEIADKLTRGLREQFKSSGLSVSPGIVSTEDGRDFTFSITDKERFNRARQEAVKEAARAMMKALEPESKPIILVTAGRVRAQLAGGKLEI